MSTTMENSWVEKSYEKFSNFVSFTFFLNIITTVLRGQPTGTHAHLNISKLFRNACCAHNVFIFTHMKATPENTVNMPLSIEAFCRNLKIRNLNVNCDFIISVLCHFFIKNVGPIDRTRIWLKSEMTVQLWVSLNRQVSKRRSCLSIP